MCHALAVRRPRRPIARSARPETAENPTDSVNGAVGGRARKQDQRAQMP